MAGTRRRPNSSLAARLFDQPEAFELFQAIRLLERLAAREVQANGEPQDPSKPLLRIRSSVPLGFASAEVTLVRRPKDGGVDLTQTLVGLTGPSGVLPHALSELVQVSVRERNFALREFFDIFNNRISGLLYEAWGKYRLTIERERSALFGTPAMINHALKSQVGLGVAAHENRTKVDDATFVHFGGLLARQGRSVVAIERVLSGTLGHRLKIEQFAGEWHEIAVSDRTRLPDRSRPTGSFAQLGRDAVVGARVFDIQSAVTVRIEELDYPAFRSLLPDGERAPVMTDLAAATIGADMRFNIRLELRADQVPGWRLGGDRDAPQACRLGWNSWLTTSRTRTKPVAAEFRPPPHLR